MEGSVNSSRPDFQKEKKKQRRDANNFGAGAIHAGGGRESRLHTGEICPKIVNIESTTIIQQQEHDVLSL